MCGIVGIWSTAELPRSRLAQCETALARLKHRGPDHAACHPFPNAVLGGARLSIIDPTAQAHQPLADHSGRWWIVFNGEIYNFIELRDELRGLGHEFHTNSDTEVIYWADVWHCRFC